MFWGVLLSFFTATVLAEKASLTITPQKIILSDGSRSQKLHVVNQGQRTGVYEVSWLDYTMNQSGGIDPWEMSLQSPWSIQSYVRYSPRRFTLKPGENRLLRVALKRSSKKVPEGEYFSHLRVLTINDNLEKTLLEGKNSKINSKQEKKASSAISISSKLAMAIPVIWRNSNAVSGAAIEIQKIDYTNNKIHLNVTRSGPLSTRGFFHVFIEKNKDRELINKPSGFIIYANINSLETTLSLIKSLPGRGKLIIIYSESIDNTEDIIAHARFST